MLSDARERHRLNFASVALTAILAESEQTKFSTPTYHSDTEELQSSIERNIETCVLYSVFCVLVKNIRLSHSITAWTIL